jgi:hypothetical protein
MAARLVLGVLVAASALGCGSSQTPGQDSAAAGAVATEIAAQFDTLSRAVTGHDWNRVEAMFADGDDVAFAMNGVVTLGRPAIMAGLRADSSVAAYIDYRWDSPRVRVLGPDAAIHVTAFWERLAMRSGDTVDIVGTWSNAFQRIGGRWRVVHMAASHKPAGQ